ncbi:MAG: hypothetical protein ACPGWR_30745, partial [Ardenticatenaceae bacterium]
SVFYSYTYYPELLSRYQGCLFYPEKEQARLLILPPDEEILRGAQEGCLFYPRMKRSTAKLRRAAYSTPE